MELMGAYEVAECLGVSTKRVYQMIMTNAYFPEPLAHLKCGQIWAGAEVRRFARSPQRYLRHGRPTKKAS